MSFPLEQTEPAITDSLMYREAAETADVVAAQFDRNARASAGLGAMLRDLDPSLVFTCARGSSDHAGVYGKYLIETRLGIPVSPVGPSVSSLYGKSVKATGTVCIAISQSGQSPDLLASARALKAAGSHLIALVNAEDSPLAAMADTTLPLCAGQEKSVAATKSYLSSLAGLARLVADWSNDRALAAALAGLPEHFARAWELDWSAAAEALQPAGSTFVLGRGIGYGCAREAALKLKETSSLHAEAYSAAEVLHGPAALVRPGYPVLALAQRDATHGAMKQVLERLSGHGASIFAAGVDGDGITPLPSLDADPSIEPMLMIQSFYRMANTLSILRGHHPDTPPHLSKVTETV
ncbi:SIS domain-containing protein [Aquisalinus flavus]|uniref:Glucosamine-fructose-6-phosphate aminotransferase n=1 Tax=Aquisalinus flavus TaxID=1526572 RepID=A0A8J2V739_9PROT|nr:SIS domain-containing protein [Aquisalinus flavus]MBD0427405.1 SIS domain-containing protein [Aquisalinus flavus]UNE47208.1 SIS domain-containing protein [Aquisalinus flavus]GGD00716.1 glucosamine-fructose-6-phosphate aminotransferase [Aquisalinus flavus]